jgi:hypothetical protein
MDDEGPPAQGCDLDPADHALNIALTRVGRVVVNADLVSDCKLTASFMSFHLTGCSP